VQSTLRCTADCRCRFALCIQARDGNECVPVPAHSVHSPPFQDAFRVPLSQDAVRGCRFLRSRMIVRYRGCVQSPSRRARSSCLPLRIAEEARRVCREFRDDRVSVLLSEMVGDRTWRGGGMSPAITRRFPCARERVRSALFFGVLLFWLLNKVKGVPWGEGTSTKSATFARSTSPYGMKQRLRPNLP